MQIGVVGLGRMGANISRRLMHAGHSCVVCDANAAVQGLARKAPRRSVAGGFSQSADGKAARRLGDAACGQDHRRDDRATLGVLLAAGDIIIDGGNTNYKDDVRRGKTLADKGIRYVDCGTSGGVWGLERGYCLMIGGPKEAVEHLDPIFAALAPGLGKIRAPLAARDSDPRAEHGYIHAGPVGAGHFVKMVHNGIEYGMMQAFAEGFDILRNRASKRCRRTSASTLNLPDIAEVWRRGSVVSSWLLDLSAAALAHGCAIGEVLRLSSRIPARAAGPSRRRSRKRCRPKCSPRRCSCASARARIIPSREKMLSAMRFGFGGHVEGQEPIDPEPRPEDSRRHSAARHAAE